jgi:hypothetical protein
MCHSDKVGAFLAILAVMSILYSPAASARTPAIDQNFATSLTDAFIGQGRPIRVVKN